MSDEIVFKVPPKPGWPCPSCGGLGHRDDGRLSISPTEFRIRPATKCSLCNGKGRVKIEAFTDEELP